MTRLKVFDLNHKNCGRTGVLYYLVVVYFRDRVILIPSDKP